MRRKEKELHWIREAEEGFAAGEAAEPEKLKERDTLMDETEQLLKELMGETGKQVDEVQVHPPTPPSPPREIPLGQPEEKEEKPTEQDATDSGAEQLLKELLEELEE